MGGWIHTFTNTVCVCVSLLKSRSRRTYTRVRTQVAVCWETCLLVLLAFTSPTFCQNRQRDSQQTWCVCHLWKEKVFDDSINQTAEQGWHCKTHIIQLPLQSKFNSKYSLTPWMQQCRIGYEAATKGTGTFFFFFTLNLYLWATPTSLESCYVYFCCPWMRYWFSRGFHFITACLQH